MELHTGAFMIGCVSHRVSRITSIITQTHLRNETKRCGKLQEILLALKTRKWPSRRRHRWRLWDQDTKLRSGSARSPPPPRPQLGGRCGRGNGLGTVTMWAGRVEGAGLPQCLSRALVSSSFRREIMGRGSSFRPAAIMALS